MFAQDCVLQISRDNGSGDAALAMSALAVSTDIAIIINDISVYFKNMFELIMTTKYVLLELEFPASKYLCPG